MSIQKKPDVPKLIKRIIEEASLPAAETEMLYKFTRQQLVELYIYLSELKKTNVELINKIQEMNNAEG